MVSLLDIRVHDCYEGDVSEFFDKETGELELPDQIDGYNVLGTDDAAVIIDRLVPHLDVEVAKKRYEFSEFDWNEFKNSFCEFEADWCADEVREEIAAALSNDKPKA